MFLRGLAIEKDSVVKAGIASDSFWLGAWTAQIYGDLKLQSKIHFGFQIYLNRVFYVQKVPTSRLKKNLPWVRNSFVYTHTFKEFAQKIMLLSFKA